MAFEKGMPKPPGSGVKKGQKQKPRIKKETVRELLDKLDINPLHQLLKYTSKESKLSDKEKARIWMEIASYCYAKPRADQTIDVENQETGFKIVIKDYTSETP